ncbi:MAG: hypothetical protein LW865_01695 [Betaproteobacteria bacterium]|nr:hypothetical protein [Betaproteobacteria bacterium]
MGIFKAIVLQTVASKVICLSTNEERNMKHEPSAAASSPTPWAKGLAV